MDVPRHVDKPWGHELWYALTDRYAGKILHVEAGGYARAREKGVLRLEGRDYVMADGDVITVRFTP